MENLAKKQDVSPKRTEVVLFPNSVPEIMPKRRYFHELFGGTVSFWKLVAFFSILTFGTNLLVGNTILDLITVSNTNFDIVYLPTVYGVTAGVWGLAFLSAIIGVKLTSDESNNAVDTIIASAMLVATVPAVHLLTGLVPDFIEKSSVNFNYYGTFYTTILIGTVTAFLALNYSRRVWQQANSNKIGAFIGCVAFSLAATVGLRLIA